jgi:hypothetical protein
VLFTAVVPSVPFYLQQLGAQPSFLGWVVSFYSLGQSKLRRCCSYAVSKLLCCLIELNFF